MPVKIVLDRDAALGALVRPGMSVIATIDTESERKRGRRRLPTTARAHGRDTRSNDRSAR